MTASPAEDQAAAQAVSQAEVEADRHVSHAQQVHDNSGSGVDVTDAQASSPEAATVTWPKNSS